MAQEFAFKSVDRPRLQAAAEAGDATAQRALDVTRCTSFMLSGAPLGVTGRLVETCQPRIRREYMSITNAA